MRCAHFALCVAGLLGTARLVSAQEASLEVPTASAAECELPPPTADQLRAILNAVQYLEEVRLHKEAATVRGLFWRRHAQMTSLLSQKTAGLERLQAEIDVLQKGLALGPQLQATRRDLPPPTAFRLRAMLKAAQYLDEAELHEEAATVRDLIRSRRAQWTSLLTQKTDELERLQAEADFLQKALDWGPQLQLNLEVLEIPRSTLRQIGFDWDNFISGREEGANLAEAASLLVTRQESMPSRVIGPDDNLFKVLDLLSSRNFVNRISSAHVLTLNGHEAGFGGGSVVHKGASDDDKPDTRTLRVTTVPAVQPDESIRLLIKFYLCESQDVGPVQEPNDDPNSPTTSSHGLQTAATLHYGETLVVARTIRRDVSTAEESPAPSPQQGTTEEILYLLLATPGLAEVTKLPNTAENPQPEVQESFGAL